MDLRRTTNAQTKDHNNQGKPHRRTAYNYNTGGQLVDALCREYDYLCHDDYDPNDDTSEEYRLKMELLTVEELIEETSTGEGYTLDEFMENWV